MAETSEKVYTVSFRSVFGAPRRERARRAVTLVREYVEKHVGTADVKIGPALNETVWMDGIQNIPKQAKIHVKILEAGRSSIAELADVPFERQEKPEGKPEGKPKEKTEGKAKPKADAKADAKA